MARLVKRYRDHPYEVSVGGETQYICACGLSGNLPYCDGTHETTAGEEPDKLYWYDKDVDRHETADAFPGIRDDQPA